MKCLKAVWQFCSYLFVPQTGRSRRKYESQKQNITYLIGRERAEGNQDELTVEYITQLLDLDFRLFVSVFGMRSDVYCHGLSVQA